MVALVAIGNGIASPDGSYLNAQSLANSLSLTFVSVQADSAINVAESVDFTHGMFGVPNGNMTWAAPVIGLDHAVTMGNGVFSARASTLNLSAEIYSPVGTLLAAAKLQGNAETVNVLTNAASIQQAVYLTQYSAGLSTIHVAAGTASNGLAVDWDTALLIHGGSLSGTFALNNPSAALSLFGHGFEVDTGSGFKAIGSGDLSNLSGSLRGYLDSGEAFAFSFTQNTPSQIHIFSTSEVPIPSVGMLFALSLGGLMTKALRNRTNKHQGR